MEHQDQLKGRYVQINDNEWKPFPDALSQGGITWKLLNVSPEMGSWAAIFDCPKGSSFNAHIHIGPGEYFLTKGHMEVRVGMMMEVLLPSLLVMDTNLVMQDMTILTS